MNRQDRIKLTHIYISTHKICISEEKNWTDNFTSFQNISISCLYIFLSLLYFYFLFCSYFLFYSQTFCLYFMFISLYHLFFFSQIYFVFLSLFEYFILKYNQSFSFDVKKADYIKRIDQYYLNSFV